jgi:hypothetical protein
MEDEEEERGVRISVVMGMVEHVIHGWRISVLFVDFETLNSSVPDTWKASFIF